jgi:glycosyltransferase involved in cell wall biosynthesis
MTLKVCLIVGDSETPHCGVKDYTHRLAEALGERGITAEVRAPSDWGMNSFMRFRRELRVQRFDVVHVQYPSIGVRGSLLPHCIGFAGIAGVCCVTVHEYISKGTLQKICTQLFRLSARTILFTTDLERNNYARYLKRLGPPQMTVCIGSNLPEAPATRVKDPTVLYFGQIRPQKGIEEFLDLAQLSVHQGKEFRFKVVGACLPRQASYFHSLQQGAPGGVDWIIGRPAEEVAQHMSRALAAYLPFPDGASCRRGSLLGALVNGLPVISKVSSVTSPELAELLLPAENGEKALAHLDTLVGSPERAASIGASCRRWGGRFSWSSIAEVHQALYEELRLSDGTNKEAIFSGAHNLNPEDA